MCQAVWQSPLLPISSDSSIPGSQPLPRIGTGERFKADLFAYLGTYENKLHDLTTKLGLFDFSSIRAALIASTPCRQSTQGDSTGQTIWGWPALERVLETVPTTSLQPRIVAQISSVASLGSGDKWLRQTLFKALSATASSTGGTPKFSIIFPTAEDIRRTIDGYACGGSIHMKTTSTQQAKQVQYLRPMLCRWAGDESDQSLSGTQSHVREAGRRRAGPHIKTYLRFTDESMTQLDWAIVTSANLSQQAWGAQANAKNEVRICSYEIGVVVWPALWTANDQDAPIMVPVFKKDSPDVQVSSQVRDKKTDKTIVGFRMPYDLPLAPYMERDQPWCKSDRHTEPDWMGRSWPGFAN